MSRTVYVLDSDGLVMPVTDFDVIRARLFADYHDGSNYRDEFALSPASLPGYWGPTGGTVSALYGASTNFFAEETESVDATVPASLTLKGKLPDTISHTAPRHEARKRTHLTFYERLTSFAVTANAAADALLAAAHEVGRGSLVSFSNSGGALPAGLVEGQPYYVLESGGGSFTVATADPDGGTTPSAVDITDAGTGTHTCHALVVCADFPPGEWAKVCNTMPIRI